MSRPAWAFRKPMAVTQLRWFRTDWTYPVCPQCSISLEREYQRFCDRCGQRLGWKDYEHARIIHLQNGGGRR